MSKKLGADFVDGFDWRLYPEAERFLYREVKQFLKQHRFARKLAKRMQKETSTELFDWIDHIVLSADRVSVEQLKKYDFKEIRLRAGNGTKVYQNEGSILPLLLVREGSDEIEITLKPENIEDCVRKLGKQGKIEGARYAPYRYAVIRREGNAVLSVVERRGSRDFVLKSEKDVRRYEKALASFGKRKREFKRDTDGINYTQNLIKKAKKNLDKERVADAFFRAERAYWQKRNNAGRIQHKRQNALGLGWGNHDHHTYRSSREHFADLIKMFELMGYKCRESFYAGETAGWGAQILEHGQCDIVIFADVDITVEEKDQDFAHRGLKHMKDLGTVGLWIGLHGESVLQAGMHHLEARFHFDRLRKDLKKHGVKTMKPFSDFSFLRQAFTEGELWKVSRDRAMKLFNGGSISNMQYSEFMKNGAIGSHMENLQRRQGYKGFNQTSVSAIIKATNPLKQLKHTRKGRGA